MVISNLRLALSWDKFAAVMGASLKSKEGEQLRYDLSRLPEEWTRHAPRSPPRKKWDNTPKSRPSKKRDRGFQITKNTLSKAKKASD
jgi:hypothetical protein